MFVPRSICVPKKKSDENLQRKGSQEPANSVRNLEVKRTSSAKNNDGDLQESRPLLHSDSTFDSAAATSNLSAGTVSDKQDRISKAAECCNDDDDDDDDEIVELSRNQRWPSPEEPVCVVCGRYGAYICDRTDQDVCSIECKRKNLERDIGKRIAVQFQQHGNLGANPITGVEKSVDKCREDDHVSFEDIEVNEELFSTYFSSNYTYTPHSTVQAFTEDNISFLRDKLEIKVQGENLVSLGLEFDHFMLPLLLSKNLKENSFIIPTPIQMQAIPIVLSKRHVLACAQTGTGKSASFLLPLVTRIFATTNKLPTHHNFCKIPLALILGPTRELCMQIEEQAKLFCKGLRNMKTALIVGGNPLPQQLHRLEQGIQILIATPGRLYDVIENHSDRCDLSHIQMVVIDEVDTMLQLGFQSQVDRIMTSVPKSCQKLMFSATIPPSIEKIATEMLSDPIFVSVGPPSTPNSSVKQIVLWVEEKSKKKRLFDLVSDGKHFIPPVVIFVGSKIGSDMLADALSKVCGVSCASLHGDKPQRMRSQILEDFQNGSYQVLVSTSVLGRGIDLLNVVMVINFDMPSTIDEYIHQVGRAGKLNKNGFAISFINNVNKDIFLRLFELCKVSNIKLPSELVNSPYLRQQQEQRGKKVGKRGNDIVKTGNLMDLIKEHRKKKRR